MIMNRVMRKPGKGKSELEEKLDFQLKVSGHKNYVKEHIFHPVRKWRFDFAWPDLKLAVEVEGGIHSNGRHVRGAGFEEDCRKYGAAMELGWNVYRCTGGMVKSGEALKTIDRLVGMAEEKAFNGDT